MVLGLKTFMEHFEGLESRYVFIGGTACELVLSERGAGFRATKDLDIVLLAEALDAEFIDRFLSFVGAGDYQHIRKATGKDEYYRFEQPSAGGYPAMIELFSKRPEYLKTIDSHLAPIRVDGGLRSLSAILLNDDYYSLLKSGVTQVDGIPVLSIEYLPVFKMKAWLELTVAKSAGEYVNSGDLSKHKNDVFRLTAVLDPDAQIVVSERIKQDITQFVKDIDVTNNDLSNLGIRGYEPQELLVHIETIYGISNQEACEQRPSANPRTSSIWC